MNDFDRLVRIIASLYDTNATKDIATTEELLVYLEKEYNLR